MTAPGAQQVGLVRRLEQAGSPSPALLDQVRATAPAGRGRPTLPWPGAEETAAPARTRAPAAAPEQLPDEELLRVAVSVLADRLRAAPRPRPLPAAPARRGPVDRARGVRDRWRRGYRLAGDPWLTADLRPRLRAQGRPPGGRAPWVLVLADEPEQMLADVWACRVLARGALPWPAFCTRQAASGTLPAAADVAAVLGRWAGHGPVHVVADPGAVGGLLGLDVPVAPTPRPSADALEVARRTGGVLGVLVPQPERRWRLRELLLPLLGEVDDPAAPRPGVPGRHREWLATCSERGRRAVADGDYPVAGDAGVLGAASARAAHGRGSPTPAGTLAVALRVLLATDREEAYG